MRILLSHRHKAERRNLDYSKNKMAKAIVYLSTSIVIIYFMLIAVVFSMVANDSRSNTATEILCGFMPFILAIDFGFRFILQQTPSQIIKPYTLLPLPKYICIDTFIFSSLFNLGNTIWFALLLPYSIMSIVFSLGFTTALEVLTWALILILANSQWYAIIRTLINKSIKWWIAVILVYGIETLPLYYKGLDVENFFDFYSVFGTSIDHHRLLPILSAIAILVILVAINRRVQFYFIKCEVAETHKKGIAKETRQMSFLNRYGELGSFLQLEIKLMLRNKNPRKALLFNSLGVVFISVIIIASDIYDSTSMANYWGLYNFVLYGSTILIKAMGYEGNYIDGLMVRKENILLLLRSKYIIISTLLIFPFVLMLPVVFTGKLSLFRLISFAIFTIGFQHFILLQMAIYNKQTIPLNTRLTSKSGIDNNYIQMLIVLFVLIVPNAFISIMLTFFSSYITYTILTIIGMAFIITNKLWLKDIYKRLMKRRYYNMEGFRESR